MHVDMHCPMLTLQSTLATHYSTKKTPLTHPPGPRQPEARQRLRHLNTSIGRIFITLGKHGVQVLLQHETGCCGNACNCTTCSAHHYRSSAMHLQAIRCTNKLQAIHVEASDTCTSIHAHVQSEYTPLQCPASHPVRAGQRLECRLRLQAPHRRH